MNFHKMNHLFPRALSLAAFCLSLASLSPSNAQISNAAPTQAAMPSSLFSRVLIVSGGPDALNNQYAIESNARYVAALTPGAKWRRVLFADGKRASRTISTVVDTPRTRARTVVSWLWELEAPGENVALRAPTLSPINGSSTSASIVKNLAAFAQSNDASGRELVYFTGHGGPGSTFLGGDDFANTLYAAWGSTVSTRQLAQSLQKSKSTAPLVLVMVQCHGGGFANTMFQNGDPNGPVWNRDFCGFFASIAERMAAGCTSEVNERDYQDFTTHFFAALSGTSRDGRAVSGADYDSSGKVSLNEAYAYANINDDSIDVPLNTSDAFLRHVFTAPDNSWQKTSFARVSKDATPWQRALLQGLSTRLHLSGDKRLQLAQKRLEAERQSNESDEWKVPEGVNTREFNAAYSRLERGLNTGFPRFTSLRGASRTSAISSATTFLASQPRDLNIVFGAYSKSVSTSGHAEVEEAQLLRFLRCARSVTLQRRLDQEGTPDQKAVFARLRTSEDRGAF